MARDAFRRWVVRPKPALDAVILKLLEKDPAQRFASAQELGEALKKIRLTLGDS